MAKSRTDPGRANPGLFRTNRRKETLFVKHPERLKISRFAGHPKLSYHVRKPRLNDKHKPTLKIDSIGFTVETRSTKTQLLSERNDLLILRLLPNFVGYKKKTRSACRVMSIFTACVHAFRPSGQPLAVQ